MNQTPGASRISVDLAFSGVDGLQKQSFMSANNNTAPRLQPGQSVMNTPNNMGMMQQGMGMNNMGMGGNNMMNDMMGGMGMGMSMGGGNNNNNNNGMMNNNNSMMG